MMRLIRSLGLFPLLLLCAAAANPALRNSPKSVPLSLQPALSSPILDITGDPIRIQGTVTTPDHTSILVRVTTSLGAQSVHTATANQGAFSCLYPTDFKGAPPLSPSMLFIDATLAPDFDVTRPGHFQAEAALILYDSAARALPDLPSAFTNDLLDAAGRVDQQSHEWPMIRTLVNLYMYSQAAHYVRIGKSAFDLANPADLSFFKNNLTLYEFDHRDRDWSTPLGHRVRRTFWQAVWNTWFNSSNNHPLDGSNANNHPSNFIPYAFTNDFIDDLIMYIMRQRHISPLDDNLQTLCHEGVENLLAMQHHEESNFALVDWRGKQETYTAGAFRYGMFENGEYLVEKKGWFYNPAFLDYIHGGVFNGRATWALGEALQHDPDSPLAPRIKQAIALSVQFCLHDALPLGYAKRTRQGNVYWYDAGEHGYLLVGLLAACAVDPSLPITGPNGDPIPLRECCIQSLNALLDLEQPQHQYSVYTNKDPLAIIALVDGATVLKDHPNASRWLQTARNVADAWMACKVDPKEHPRPLVHFGLRTAPDRMTFNWRHLSKECADHNTIHFYISGHWIHALARLYHATGDPRYRDRAMAMVRYLCGVNPWHVRLFTELGGVYNWVDDMDGDGIEDWLKQDMYPESTAYCQIGILHLLRAMAKP